MDKSLQGVLNKDEEFNLYYKNSLMINLVKSGNFESKQEKSINLEDVSISKDSGMIPEKKHTPKMRKTANKLVLNNFPFKTSSDIYKTTQASSEMSATSHKSMSGITNLMKTENNTAGQEVFPKIRLKKHNQTQQNFGPFLNVLGPEKKVEIRNPTVKRMLDETVNHGPYYTHCPSCQNKNLTFFQHLKEHEAVKIIKYIQEDKLRKHNKNLYIKSKLLNKPGSTITNY
jgi:hypothetical protein